jgi:hypothetical protein
MCRFTGGDRPPDPQDSRHSNTPEGNSPHSLTWGKENVDKTGRAIV